MREEQIEDGLTREQALALAASRHQQSPHAYVQAQRERLVAVARAILDGELGVILGARHIAGLFYAFEDEDDPDRLVWVGIDSETDHLPVDEERRNWSPQALARKDEEIAECEAFFKDTALKACRRLLLRFADLPKQRSSSDL